MPFSNIKQEGLENKIANVLGEAMGAQVSFYWRPMLERALNRETFDARMCDVMIDVPANYGSQLTTTPVYRTTYVLAYRNDKGFDFNELRRSQAQAAEDRCVPDLGHSRGAGEARHRRQSQASRHYP